MQKTFELDRRHKKDLLISAGKYFRNWKTNMTRDHVYGFMKENPDVFPPPIPHGWEDVISPEEWLQFVESRLTDEWKAKRIIMQNYRAMYQYNHKTSRGGYVRVEEQIMAETGNKIYELDRAEVWA